MVIIVLKPIFDKDCAALERRCHNRNNALTVKILSPRVLNTGCERAFPDPSDPETYAFFVKFEDDNIML